MPIFLKRHLGNGVHKYKWQIRGDGVEPKYFDPISSGLILHACTLKNSKAAAERIHSGACRQPVARIKAEQYEVNDGNSESDWILSNPIYYDPKVQPYFRSQDGTDIDNHSFKTLITVGSQIYEGIPLSSNTLSKSPFKNMTITIKEFLELIWFYAFNPTMTKISFYLEDNSCHVKVENIDSNIAVTSTYTFSHEHKKPLYFEMSDLDLKAILELIYDACAAEQDFTDDNYEFFKSNINLYFNGDLTVALDDGSSLSFDPLLTQDPEDDYYEEIAVINYQDWENLTELAYLTTETTGSNLIQLPIVDTNDAILFYSIGKKAFVTGYNEDIFFRTAYDNQIAEYISSDLIMIPKFAIIATTEYPAHCEVVVECNEDKTMVRLRTPSYCISFPYEECDDDNMLLRNIFMTVQQHEVQAGLLSEDYRSVLNNEYIELVYDPDSFSYYFSSYNASCLRYDRAQSQQPHNKRKPIVKAASKSGLPGHLWNDFIRLFPHKDALKYRAYCLNENDYCFSLESDNSKLLVMFTTYKQDETFNEQSTINFVDSLEFSYEYKPAILPNWNVATRQRRFRQFTDFTKTWHSALSDIALHVDTDDFEVGVERTKLEYELLSQHTALLLDSTEDYEDILAAFLSIAGMSRPRVADSPKGLAGASRLRRTLDLSPEDEEDEIPYSLSKQFLFREPSTFEFDDFEEMATNVCPAIEQLSFNCRFFKTIIRSY